MSIQNVLKSEEKAIFTLRQLYDKYGYRQYKMSKFEEYDLYVRNKDFLISDSIITFTDTNGKLLALKPDVTLSIIKNTKDSYESVNKLYYNENVYRISKGDHTYKEIMQTGLECIGKIDSYTLYEVISLAAQSLLSVSPDCVLDISHLGILSDVIEKLSIPHDRHKNVLKCIGEKNTHELSTILNECGVSEDKINVLCDLIGICGCPSDVIPKLKNLLDGYVEDSKLEQLRQITTSLSANGYGDIINVDFSLINDMNYYNGIVFKGFINTIPVGVLSGGQYDNLMKKMGKKSCAVGFAVYLDLLKRFESRERNFDVDTVLLYDETVDPSTVNEAVIALQKDGKSVLALNKVPTDVKYKQLVKVTEKGVVILENNA